MSLRKLIYVSDAAIAFDEAEVMQLALRAIDRNSRLGVTGVLTMREGTFLQYLEGPPDKLEALWTLIRNDDRHTVRNSIDYEVEDDQRIFSDWHMRYLSMRDPEAQTTMVLEQMFRNLEIPDADYAKDTLEAFAGKLAEDFA